MMRIASRFPALRGGLLALLAAGLFGVSTPLVQKLGLGLGPFTTAALLYAGAAGMAALLRRPAQLEARVQRSDLRRLLAVAGFGAILGPALLAWGLQRSSGTGASLMLSLEAVFTALLAWGLYGETMDRRVWTGVLLLLAGGIALTSHGTKASARAAANMSPEPFSNWALSFGEDALAVWLTWFAMTHPTIAVVVVAVLFCVSLFLLYHLFHLLRRTLQKLAET